MNTQAKLIVLLLGSTLLWVVPSDVLARFSKNDSHLAGQTSPLNECPFGEKEFEDLDVEVDGLKLRFDVSFGLITADDSRGLSESADEISFITVLAHDGSTVLSRPPPA